MPHIKALMLADGTSFVTRPVYRLELSFAGIAGDRHAGLRRGSDVRTPWHPRGTPIANTRQLSLVSTEECDQIAATLGLSSVDPVLLGANVVLSGVPELSLLAPGTRFQMASGATIFVTEHNAPCRHPAAEIAAAHDDPKLAARFVKAALGRRGLVGMVEREGPVTVGDEVACIASPAMVRRPSEAVPA